MYVLQPDPLGEFVRLLPGQRRPREPRDPSPLLWYARQPRGQPPGSSPTPLPCASG